MLSEASKRRQQDYAYGSALASAVTLGLEIGQLYSNPDRCGYYLLKESVTKKQGRSAQRQAISCFQASTLRLLEGTRTT